MIHALTPYPAMKDSGVPWLGQVPEHWDVTRSKWLFTSSKELAHPDDVQLSATQAYGVIPQEEYERRSGARVVKISMHLDKRKHVEKDDFIISMRSFQGGLERAWASGAIRSSYVVLKPGSGVNVGFFSHLLKSHDYIRALQVTGGFIRDGQDLTESNFRDVDLPLVPLTEQAAIFRYLDHADRRIRWTIAAKQKLIKLLQEQKQVIIHQAVTRGLDPDVKLKPSGVEWLGDVPDGWENISIGSVTTQIQTGPFGSQLHSHEYVRDGVPVINPSHLKNGAIIPDKAIAIPPLKAEQLQRHRLIAGDIVAARRGELGRCAVVTELEAGWICGTGSLVIRLKQETVIPDYFQLVFSSQGVKDWLSLTSVGATMDNLNEGLVQRLKIPLPPLCEQLEVINFVNSSRRVTAEAISRAQIEISLLREYRTRLIANVVTGKLDVRAAAALLPDTESEALPGDMDLLDSEDELDADEVEAEAVEL